MQNGLSQRPGKLLIYNCPITGKRPGTPRGNYNQLRFAPHCVWSISASSDGRKKISPINITWKIMFRKRIINQSNYIDHWTATLFTSFTAEKK